MDFPLVRAAVPRLEALDSCASTNSELAVLVGAATPRLEWFTTVLTEDQTAGRGRLDRTWVAPRGASVAVSTLVPDTLGGWTALAAGLAMVEALRPLLGDRVTLKWPNDVLVDDAKICGVLAEWTPHGIVVGAGLNTAMTVAELPVPTATSLQIAGVAPVEADAVVARYLTALRGHLARTPEELRERVMARLSTRGRTVRIGLPDGSILTGWATGIDVEGRLVVDVAGRGKVAVAAGDVVHVRS
ncbi:biotin--[acetyl-CoA-carboxylase] ligase [Pseudolysinimonas yzui]|uniref:biotin--[biotin carboxyl-carrier protein] ligase n=1 Tax=Pseudolysinimonas yzui TaxID=2708254 RepID=A0A8J3GQ94_9MICO|nr:biotin--[acetyl-CoA-carboxylase] ligase [Pseudolysinimonas yzui]GHF15296.1 putative biotin--acetyl-CoA-carboxylase ligase (BirA bifunctional protein) [Pseudolysinimonas yzui]